MNKNISQKLAVITAGAALLGLGTLSANSAQASSLFGESFAGSYSSLGLGQVPGIPGPYGGITFLPDNPNTLLITGRADFPDAKIYSIGVNRDSSNRITGFSGEATFFAEAVGGTSEFTGADGGLTYGPNNVLFFTTYDTNTLGQILPGSTAPNKLVNLTDLGIEASTGALRFVPAGFPGEGRLKITSYSGSTFYDTTVSSDGSGTFNIEPPTTSVRLGGEETFVGPEGFVYVNESNPGFDAPSLLIAQWGEGRGVAAYEVDANGDPIIDTERQFLDWPKSKSGGPEGMIVDPLTGDLLVTLYGEGDAELTNQILRVSAEPSELPVADTNPFDSATSLDLSSGFGSASGAVSTGNRVFSFNAKAGDLLSFDVNVTDILSGTGYKDDDSVIYLYNSAGQILAVGDDSLDSFESGLLNFLVPEDGTYYAAVTTFGNEPIIEQGRPFNTLTGFEENGLSNLAFDLGVSSTPLPETARLFNIALAADPSNPVGSFLIDGNQVLFIDLNGSRNTDLTGPLTVFVNANDNTLTFDNFEFVLQFAEPFPSTDLNDILDILDEVGVTAIIPPDELVQDIVFSEQQIPDTTVPEPTSVLGLLAFGALGAGSALKRKQQQKG